MLSLLKSEASNPEARFDPLALALKKATAPSRDLYALITNACIRLPAIKQVGKAAAFDRLVETGAWCDAALALIALELPAWSIRRLVHDHDEWFCSLTREPNLPAEVDDTVDASHQSLPLAILGAFVEARRKIGALHGAQKPIVPQIRPAPAATICCDNFA